MGRELGRAAEAVGCSERTVRRYVADGVLHARPARRGQFELPATEEQYLRSHWTLLRGLKAALRTERDVRLAVLFGSAATGEDHAGSDVDLLVEHRRSGLRALMGLQLRLRQALDRPVHVVTLAQAEETPALLADVLHEGRPLIDRDGRWRTLQEREAEPVAEATT